MLDSLAGCGAAGCRTGDLLTLQGRYFAAAVPANVVVVLLPAGNRSHPNASTPSCSLLAATPSNVTCNLTVGEDAQTGQWLVAVQSFSLVASGCQPGCFQPSTCTHSHVRTHEHNGRHAHK